MEIEIRPAAPSAAPDPRQLRRRRLKRLLNHFTPPGTCTDHHEMLRARILVSVCFASGLILGVALLGVEIAGFEPVSDGSTWMSIMFFTAVLLPLAVLRLSRSMPLAVSTLCGGIGGGLVLLSYYCGGPDAVMLATLTVVPVFGAMLGGRGHGLAWSIAALGVWAAFAALAQTGWTFPDMAPPEHRAIARAFCIIATGGTIFAAVLIYETLNRSLREDLARERSLFERMAGTDHLTQLANRRAFNQQLALGVERASRTRRKLGLFVLDLNDFKPVNDELGHPAGDRLLEAIARRLRDDLRLTDRVARIGGDEFAVIVEDALQRDDFELVGHRLMDAISRPEEIRGRAVAVTASVGVAIFPDDEDAPAALFDRADEAMYRAKSLGGTIVFSGDHA